MISSQDPKLIEEYNRIIHKYENKRKHDIKKTYIKILNEINEMNLLNEQAELNQLSNNQQLMNLIPNVHPAYNLIQSMLFPNVQLYILQVPQ
jgi:hypothetical protein